MSELDSILLEQIADKLDDVGTIKGDKGEKGDKGDRGEKGDRGPEGPPGKDGKDGRDGKDGKQGLKGDKGDRGLQGEKGEKGDPAPPTGGLGTGGGTSRIRFLDDGHELPYRKKINVTGATLRVDNTSINIDIPEGGEGGAHPDLATHDAMGLATDAELATHAADTTSVHGIPDTADLVLTDDARLTDPRIPEGAAGGVLSGTYPDPGFAVDMATQAELNAHTHALDDLSDVDATTSRDVGDVLAWDGSQWESTAPAAGGSGDLVHIAGSVTTVNVVNTTTETDLVSTTITGAQPAVGDVYRLTAFGDIVNNSAGAVTYRFRFKLGATTILDTNTFSLAQSANAREWRVQVEMFIVTGTSQRATAILSVGAASTESWQPSTNAIFNAPGYGTAAEDTSTNKTLALSIQMGTASASADCDIHGWVLERVIA